MVMHSTQWLHNVVVLWTNQPIIFIIFNPFSGKCVYCKNGNQSFFGKVFRGICSLASVFMKNRVQRSVNRNEKKSSSPEKSSVMFWQWRIQWAEKKQETSLWNKVLLGNLFPFLLKKNWIWHLSRNTKEISLVARKCLVVNFRLQSQQWRTRLNKKETKPNLCLGFI